MPKRTCKDCVHFREVADDEWIDYECHALLPMWVESDDEDITPTTDAKQCKAFEGTVEFIHKQQT